VFHVFANSHAGDDRRFQFLAPKGYVLSVTRKELEDLWEDILTILRNDDDYSGPRF